MSRDALRAFDDIIDVRSPAEFAEDHLPGAINLPALCDEQRAEVGTIYVQRSVFEARRIGAAYVARNVAAYLTGPLAGRPRGWRPLIYCWRGGARSGSVATILAEVGWRTTVLEGGWRTWRRAVVDATQGDAPDPPLLLVDGQTGCAKTEILVRAMDRGAAAIDLEGAANHRGSAFGAMADAPPRSQKRFESLIFEAMREGERRLAAGGRYLVEAESARIGPLRAPARLWRAMKAAPRVEITAPIEARVDYLETAYAAFAASPKRIGDALSAIARRHSAETIGLWRALAEDGDITGLIRTLLTEHYDPLYDRSRRKRMDEPVALLELPDLSDDSLERAAKEISAIAGG
ncbi:MAG: tRNA 2-selenouridine(34) synthase MnmH [Pseudomonadota bacterium]